MKYLFIDFPQNENKLYFGVNGDLQAVFEKSGKNVSFAVIFRQVQLGNCSQYGHLEDVYRVRGSYNDHIKTAYRDKWFEI